MRHPAISHALAGVIVIATGALAQPRPVTWTQSELSAWVTRASSHASGGQRHLSQPVADAMAEAALANPILAEDRAIMSVASIEVSLAWYETGGQLVNDPSGSNDHGNSACWAQVYLPNGARTLEGWTGAELRADPKKCARVAVRLIKASLLSSPTCNGCGLVTYARGHDTPEARRLSQTRMGLAERLMKEVPR